MFICNLKGDLENPWKDTKTLLEELSEAEGPAMPLH